MIEAPIHCLLDCLVSGIRRSADSGEHAPDDRPAYLGVWNSPFIADENGFSYFSESIDPDADLYMFERLYGSCVRRWQEAMWPREDKIEALLREVSGRRTKETVIVLVDLFYMPYSAVFYGIKHFPHMVTVEEVDEEVWRVRDPFFGWEGTVPRETVVRAFGCEQLSGGLTLVAGELREPDEDAVAEAFREQFTLETGNLIEGVDAYMTRLASGEPGYSAETLFGTIGQVGVVAKRWKGYGLLAQYFADRSGQDGSEANRRLDTLLVRWESFVLAIVRLGVLGVSGASERLKNAHAKLADLRAMEAETKLELMRLFSRWEETRHAATR